MSRPSYVSSQGAYASSPVVRQPGSAASPVVLQPGSQQYIDTKAREAREASDQWAARIARDAQIERNAQLAKDAQISRDLQDRWAAVAPVFGGFVSKHDNIFGGTGPLFTQRAPGQRGPYSFSNKSVRKSKKSVRKSKKSVRKSKKSGRKAKKSGRR